MRAAIGSTILIATLAGPFMAQAKAALGVLPDRSRAQDINAKLIAAKAARFVAAVQACATVVASAPAVQAAPWPEPVPLLLAAPASTEAMLAAKIHHLRPAVLRL